MGRVLWGEDSRVARSTRFQKQKQTQWSLRIAVGPIAYVY